MRIRKTHAEKMTPFRSKNCINAGTVMVNLQGAQDGNQKLKARNQRLEIARDA
jgi:hypothetical protein